MGLTLNQRAALETMPWEWVLVPREPTPEMMQAFYRDSGDPALYPEYFAVAYRDLLAAAPQPLSASPKGDDLEPVAAAWWHGVAPDGEVGFTSEENVAKAWDAGGWLVRALVHASRLQLIAKLEEAAEAENAILKREIAELREATLEEAAKVIEEGFDKAVGESYRNDGKPSKNDKCPHGRYHYEDCDQCCADAVRALSGREVTWG